jgi:hypothetical protein
MSLVELAILQLVAPYAAQMDCRPAFGPASAVLGPQQLGDGGDDVDGLQRGEASLGWAVPTRFALFVELLVLGYPVLWMKPSRALRLR